jgi:hypothetical protein
MTRDRVDALAERLFAAAREERPDRDLCARVERATASSADGAARSGESAHERRAGRVRRPLLLRGLLAAIVCGGFAALVLWPRTRDAVLISAERAPGGAAARPGTLQGPDGVAGKERARLLPPPEALLGTSEPNEIQRPLPGAPATTAAETGSLQTGAAPRATTTNAPAPARDGARRAARPDAPRAAPDDDRAAAPPSTPTLSNELGALKQIRQALRNGDGSAALALLDRYDGGEYGASLALEASVLRVEALDAVGRRADAEALARRFVRDNPDSPLAERAQRFIDRTEPARPASGTQP